jgi:Mn2+/Fe2+ NRAMP family transporter
MINALILPIALAVILLAANKSDLMRGYKHPIVLQVIGWVVVGVMTWMGVLTIQSSLKSLL